MPTSGDSKPRVLQVAELIEQDIRARGLKPGDSYLGVADTAKMLRVNTATANKALQLLAQRRLLDRRQRRGTVVAKAPTAAEEPALRRVRLIVPQNYLRAEGLLADGVIVGVQRELTGADIRFEFLPATGDEEFVQNVVDDALRGGMPEGFVLVRSTLAAQKIIYESGMPSVVFGTAYPSMQRLASIDRDHAAAGRLLTEHVLAQGHRRVLVLMRERVLPGDFIAMDAIQATLAKHGLPADAMIVRHLPADHDLVREVVRASLRDAMPTAKRGRGGGSMAESLPGVVARSEPLAMGAVDAVTAMKLEVGRDVAVTVADVYRRGDERSVGLPHTWPTIGPEEMGEHLGRMLAQQVSGEMMEPEHQIIEVHLRLPDGA